MKRALSILLSLLMLMSLTLTACAADEPQTSDSAVTISLQIGNPTMTVNGTDMPIDEQGTVPVIVNDRTLLPVRAVVEQMGGTVGWNGETEEVTLNYGDDEIKLTIDSAEAFLNGEKQALDVAPTVMNDRTMLPIRFIAESFKFSVDWNVETQTVTVTNTVKDDTQTEPAQQPSETASKSLVVYFSATGNTKTLAEKIADATGSELYEIVPEEPYTSDDLNYSNDDCRANKEQNDDSSRPAISGKIENLSDYDTIYLGYPIWWGTMPKIINTFLESYDFSGKTIMPFCTSGGSGIASSVSAIKAECPNADVRDGLRGTGSTDEAQIKTWAENK